MVQEFFLRNVAAGDYYIAAMDEQTPWQNGYYTWTHDKFATYEEAEAYVQKRIAETTAYAVYFDKPAGTGYIDTVHCYAGAWRGRHGYYDDFKSLGRSGKMFEQFTILAE